MIDITKIKEYQEVYANLPQEQPGDAEVLESKRSAYSLNSNSQRNKINLNNFGENLS